MTDELVASELSFMGRPSVRLANGLVRATLDPDGGMVPELGIERESRFLNAHWIPPFRDPSGAPWSETLHGRFWKSRLLHTLAGDFICSPNFGPGGDVDGAALPPHGWTANTRWRLLGSAADAAAGIAYADFALDSPSAAMPLVWTRRDFVASSQSALFSTLSIRNEGNRPLTINLAHHNTLGPPFLESGCRISLCSRSFMTAPKGTEFDDTGRLALGAEFDSLSAAPLRRGGTADISLVPGMIGVTDFVTGAVPRDARLGWSCVLNPRLGLAYLCLFPGNKGLPEGEIALSFNDLWMQYGGRPFTPWAETEGGADRTYCLGTENAVAAFANGLDYARSRPELLGSPTLVEIPAKGERRLHYASAIVTMGSDLIGNGIDRVEAEAGSLLMGGGKASQCLPISADFELSRRVCRDLNGGF
ncbi:MAG: hypothetical protein ACLQMF_09450 [Rectinemataceae bacterium]